VLYVEPGGYYEHGTDWQKRVVACVVGRWTSKPTRAVDRAGAMVGSGDTAEDKERWFMDSFGVPDLCRSENPVVSEKGAVVTNIRRHSRGADRCDGAERGRARLRAARRSRAEALERQRPGAVAAGGGRPAAGDCGEALRRADRGARRQGRLGCRASGDEGHVRRLALDAEGRRRQLPQAVG
jgi:hypothetical protein